MKRNVDVGIPIVCANKESVSLFMYVGFLMLGYGYWAPGEKEIEKNMRFWLVKKLSCLRDTIKALKWFEHINGNEYIGYQ